MTTQRKALPLLQALEGAFFLLLAIRSVTEFFSHTLGWNVFVGPIEINASVVTMLLTDIVGGGYLVYWWARGESILNRLGFFFLLWVVSLAPWVYHAAVIGGSEGLVGVREWIRLFSLIVVYLTALAIVTRRGVHQALNACLWALPVPLAFAYYQIIISWIEPNKSLSRVLGPTFHPNGLAFFLVAMMALTTWKLFQPGLSIKGRALWSILWGAQLIALLTTISGNSWLALVVFLLFFSLLSKDWKLKATAAVILVGILTAFGLIYLGDFSLGNFNLRGEIVQDLAAIGLQNQEGTLSGGSLTFRFVMWGQLFHLWQQNPFLGYGLDRTRFVNPQVGKYAHNDFVRYLVEGGIFGLISYLMFLTAAGYELWRLRKRELQTKDGLLMALGIGLFFAWVVGSFSEDLISFTAFQVYLWTVLAAVSAPLSIPQKVPEPSTPQRAQGKKSFGFFSRRKTPISPGRSRDVGQDEPDQVVCPRCQRPLPSVTFLCAHCIRLTINKIPFLALFSGVVALVILIGFYIWNQGSGIETFFWGWALWYTFLAVLLRHHRGYLLVLFCTILVGLITIPLLYPTAGRNLQVLSQWALWGVVLLIFAGWLASWWQITSQSQQSMLQGLPASLLGLGLIAEGLNWGSAILKTQYPPVVLSGWASPYLSFWTSPPFRLTVLLVLLIALADRWRTASRSALALQAWRKALLFTVQLGWETIRILILGFARSLKNSWIPLASLGLIGWTVGLILRGISDFIYGNPLAWGGVALEIGGIFALFLIFWWSVSSPAHKIPWLNLGLSFGVYLGMIQVGVWVATGVLWGMAQLLPQFELTRRFVPLLLERPLGLYTWISLGGIILLGLALGAIRTMHKDHTITFSARLSEK